MNIPKLEAQSLRKLFENLISYCPVLKTLPLYLIRLHLRDMFVKLSRLTSILYGIPYLVRCKVWDIRVFLCSYNLLLHSTHTTAVLHFGFRARLDGDHLVSCEWRIFKLMTRWRNEAHNICISQTQ